MGTMAPGVSGRLTLHSLGQLSLQLPVFDGGLVTGLDEDGPGRDPIDDCGSAREV